MSSTMEYECVECGETEPLLFYYNRKTLCREHESCYRNPKTKAKMVKKYKCIVCGITDVTKFYKCNKNRCKEHYKKVDAGSVTVHTYIGGGR